MHKEDRRLWRAVQQTVRPFSLTATSSRNKLLVGVSGGADSLALLHLLWQQLGNERLTAAHLNHQLRPEAEEDAAFVVQTAVSWNIPCKVGHLDVAALAKRSRLSLEAAGRVARYRFLSKKADEVGAKAVVVAHHADDQVETVLLHLLRGSGSVGLRGMRPVSQVPERDDLWLVRPFLNTSRTEIEAYCTRHGLTPREDASNEDVQFTRNRIRHDLLPLLQTYNPQIKNSLQQLAIITADEYAALRTQFEDKIWPELLLEQGDDWLLLDRQQFMIQAAAWQRLALRQAVQQLTPQSTDISFQTIELARNLILENQSGTEATLPGGLTMQVLARELIFGEASNANVASLPQLHAAEPVQLHVPGEISLSGGWVITANPVETVQLQKIQQNRDPWHAFVALNKEDGLWLRLPKRDERFQPLGMAGRSQAIYDLLSDRKVVRGKRPLWPIVATDAYPVWIVGQHLDERARVTDGSLRVVQLTCTRRGA